MKTMIDVNIKKLNQAMQDFTVKMKRLQVNNDSLPAIFGISEDTLDTYMTGFTTKIRIKNLYKILMLIRVLEIMNDEDSLKYFSWKLELDSNVKTLKQSYFDNFYTTLEENGSKELALELLKKRESLLQTNEELRQKIQTIESSLEFSIVQYEKARMQISKYSTSEIAIKLNVSRVTAGKLANSMQDEPNDSSLTLSRIISINEKL